MSAARSRGRWLALVALAAAMPLQAQVAVGGAAEGPGQVIPLGPMIRRAYAAGTRDSTGRPGPRYWQQTVDYTIDAHLDVTTAVLHGAETVTLHNTSPDTLRQIVLRLYQNYFTPTVDRNDYVTDITDGITVEHLSVNGQVIDLGNDSVYTVDGTVAYVRPAASILPGADATLDVVWHFTVPNVPLDERGERMGRWDHTLYQVAQWYPQVAMYDDLRGWDTDQYLGTGEFYNQFGRFDVRITVPAGWIVGATGTLADSDQVLSARTKSRLEEALTSDATTHVVAADERGAGRATAAGDSLTWHFTAPLVNDFAFATSKDFVWDATRAMAPNLTAVNVLYLPEHQGYLETARYAQFALEHHARFVMPYAFPQATVCDGPETGMEYPMIIFSGPGFGVTTHELGHQWFPMTVSSNETWYGWQDEGLNEYIDGAAGQDFTGHAPDPLQQGRSYRRFAGSELEAPLMWPSDYAGPLYTLQAYVKPPLAMWALGGVVGDSAVRRAFAAYAEAWRFKHPSPWDFFMAMQHDLGRDLSWFWNQWWFTTETDDQALQHVAVSSGTLTVTVANHGSMRMPVIVRVDYASGAADTLRQPASAWFTGAQTVSLTAPLHGRRVVRVTLDPENRFQDLDRSDNVWEAKP